MTVKTITITKEAYDSLARVKRADESFSQLFLRLAPKKATIKDIAGILRHSPEERRAWHERIRNLRAEFNIGSEKRITDVRTRLKRDH